MTDPGHEATPIDQPAPVRAGEALDQRALLAYLRARGIGDGDELAVAQYPRGYSNLTYHVTRGTLDCILRRPPLGVGKGIAHDVAREARVLASLGAVYTAVPRILDICADPAVLGAPFFLMERVAGIILRDRLPDGLVLGAPQLRRLSSGAIDALAGIHAIDYRAAGLAELGRPEGYAARQVDGWTRRYVSARTGAQPEVERAAQWLAAHLPEAPSPALLHNDFKYDNLVLAADDPTRIVAVLDWEMATTGNPWMDLGTTLAYWVEANDPPALRALGLGVTALPGNLTREQLLARYASATGREVESPVFHYVYGLFKVAVIVQQIYARFVAGHTQDARFARLDEAVRALGRAAGDAIRSGRISGAGA